MRNRQEAHIPLAVLAHRWLRGLGEQDRPPELSSGKPSISSQKGQAEWL